MRSRKIHIAYVIPNLVRGGAEGQLIELLGRIDRKRFQTTVVLFANVDFHGVDKLADDVLVLGIPDRCNSRSVRSAVRASSGIWTLAKHFRRIRPDVMHAFLPAASILGCLAGILAGVPIRIVGRRSMLANYRGKSRLLAFVDRWPLRFAQVIIGNCRAISEETVADGIPADKVLTIYNGIDAERFSPGYNGVMRSQLGFGPGTIVVGMVANFTQNKRHIDFVRAAAMTHRQRPEVRFLLVGEFAATYEQVAAEIKRLGLESAIVVQPLTTRAEDFLRSLDIYVSTSATEGLSNSILEAMASAKPIVATDVGGNSELVRNGHNGFLVPVASPERVADAVVNLICEPGAAQENGRTQPD